MRRSAELNVTQAWVQSKVTVKLWQQKESLHAEDPGQRVEHCYSETSRDWKPENQGYFSFRVEVRVLKFIQQPYRARQMMKTPSLHKMIIY